MITYEKVIYISHPYGGLKSNEEETARIILDLYKRFPNYLFVSPIHAFSFEYTFCDYQKGLDRCLWLLDKCDECWLYGDWQFSKGCVAEAGYCNDNNIPCINKNYEYKNN